MTNYMVNMAFFFSLMPFITFYPTQSDVQPLAFIFAFVVLILDFINRKVVLDKFEIKEAVFLDDAIEHLETVNDPRVICLFADWGYGENSNFKICDWRKF